jgi:hypothetical protein
MTVRYFIISNFRRQRSEVRIKCDSSLFEAGLANVVSFYERPQKLILETSKFTNYFRGDYKQLAHIKELEVNINTDTALGKIRF